MLARAGLNFLERRREDFTNSRLEPSTISTNKLATHQRQAQDQSSYRLNLVSACGTMQRGKVNSYPSNELYEGGRLEGKLKTFKVMSQDFMVPIMML